jgi:NAD(P)-dependent dehydrogenase (short-subunit alcohol dehydrogenase family)
MPTLATVRASNATWDPSYTPVGVFVGGTSGIGEGIAEAFARHTKGNAHIILVGRNRPTATAILARLEKPPVPGLTREFLPCDLTLIANAKRTAAAIRERFPRIHFLFLSAGAVSLKGLDIGEEGVDRQMAALYYSKWAFIEGLLPALRAAHGAGEDARVAALHTAGRGGPVDLDDLGLMKGISGGLKSVRKLVPQLASYQDLMAEVRFSLLFFSFLHKLTHLSQAFAAHEANTGISFTHAFPGTVDTPLLRASPSAILRAVHYLRFLLFPTLMFRAMTISECGEYQLYGLLQVRLCSFPLGFSSFSLIAFIYLYGFSVFSLIISFLSVISSLSSSFFASYLSWPLFLILSSPLIYLSLSLPPSLSSLPPLPPISHN